MVWPVLGLLFAQCGDIEQATAALGRISDPGLRAWALDCFVADLAAKGDLKSARIVLSTVKDDAARNRGLFSIASIAASHHRFSEAETIADSMVNEPARQDLFEGLARAEAEGGQYDMALNTAKKYLGDPVFAERDRMELREFIERCRKRGRRQEATQMERTLRDSIYTMGAMPLVPTPESIAVHRARVNDPADPAKRTVSAFLLARRYKHDNDPAKCQELLTVARQTVRAVPNGRGATSVLHLHR